MPRKKSEPTEMPDIGTQDTSDKNAASIDTEHTAPKTRSRVSKKESSVTADVPTDIGSDEPRTKTRSVGKLDTLDFYRTQLKLEGLESQVAKTNEKASTISHQIMEVLKEEKNLDDEISDGKPDGLSTAHREEQFEKTQERMEDLYKRLEDTQAEKDALNHEIAQLRSDLARKYHENRKISDNPGESYGIITRASETTFTSNLFHDGNYDVRLARDGSYIKFKPDVEGRAICINGTIRIPMLSTYLPFKGTREFGVIPINSNTLMIRL